GTRARSWKQERQIGSRVPDRARNGDRQGDEEATVTTRPGQAPDTDLQTPSRLLRTWAAETPDAPMLTLGPRTLTWGEAYERAKRVAGALEAGGVRAGDRVAFLDRNGIEYFEVFFGCALLGAVSVAVNWRLAPTEMAAIIEDAGASVLFWGPDYDAAVKELTPLVTCLTTRVPLDELPEWRDRRGGPAADPGFEPSPHDVVTQLYTSGTTGLPKGVMLSGKNLSCILHEADQVFHIRAD